jgi:hypothetical protein
MFVNIEDHDEVVIECKFADIKVVYSEDEDTFYTVWKRNSGKWQTMWRGNFAGCVKEFSDIVGDLFADRTGESLGA